MRWHRCRAHNRRAIKLKRDTNRRDSAPEHRIGGQQIDDIHPGREIGLGQRLGCLPDQVQAQRAVPLQRQVRIGITPRPAMGARPEHERPRTARQLRAQHVAQARCILRLPVHLQRARPYEQRQRNPGDYEVWVSQGPITVHAREHLGATDAGVALYRRRLRRAVRRMADGGMPLQPTAVVTEPIPTYGGDTVLRAPMRSNDDRKWMSDLSKRVADIYLGGDDVVGVERRSRIRAGLAALEAELQ